MAEGKAKATRKKGNVRGRPRKGWRELFLADLAMTMNVSASAANIGVDRRTVYEHRNNDTEFAAAWDDAIETAADAAEQEMYRRAVKGVEKPVYQNGKRVGVIREYSDTLLIFYMKGRRSVVYGDRSRHELSGPNGGPLPLGFDEAAADIYPEKPSEPGEE